MDRRHLLALLIATVIGAYLLFPRSTAQGDHHEVDDEAAAVHGSSGSSRAEPVIFNNQRWTLFNAQTAYEDRNPNSRLDAVNTVLLDSETGETWILWPNDKGPQNGYTWMKMNR